MTSNDLFALLWAAKLTRPSSEISGSGGVPGPSSQSQVPTAAVLSTSLGQFQAIATFLLLVNHSKLMCVQKRVFYGFYRIGRQWIIILIMDFNIYWNYI
jgi:hypothetical protein